MADLCSLKDVKTRHRIRDDRWDDLITQWIDASGVLIEEYCGGRQFSPDAEESVRVFTVAGGSALIDDLSAPPSLVELHDSSGVLFGEITAHTLTVPRNLPAGGWKPVTALEFRIPVLDGWEVHVTGKWGHPRVPPHVKEAAIFTIRDWLRDVEAVTTDAPDTGEPTATGPGRGIPFRARMLLDGSHDWTVPA